MIDSYLTIKGPGEGEFKDKGSKFFAFAYPVATVEEATEKIEELRKRFHDARHVCFAWRLGIEGKETRAADDGEPSHSAGDPILNAIRSKNATDIVIGVVRYFGGTKLGVSGLIEAYGTSAREALEDAGVIEIILKKSLRVTYSYEQTNVVNKIMHHQSLKPDETEFTEKCVAVFRIRLTEVEVMRKVFEEAGIEAEID